MKHLRRRGQVDRPACDVEEGDTTPVHADVECPECKELTFRKVPVVELRNMLSMLGSHYQRPPTWGGDRMCICGDGPVPCRFAQLRDKLSEFIGE